MTENRVSIIGITPEGPDGLSGRARRIIDEANLIFGGERLLSMFPDIAGKKTAIRDNLLEVVKTIQNSPDTARIAVLASGDPGFFGIAGYLANKLGKERLEILPNVSSVQTAFARIGESWHDAVFASTHGRNIVSILPVVFSSNKIAVLTDERNNPVAIARFLCQRGLTDFTAYICQNIDMDSEKINEYPLSEVPDMPFSPLSILILIREKNAMNSGSRLTLPSIVDNEFYQRQPDKGLITKQEIRAISLSKLRLHSTSVLWDIGAGSGAISVEASFILSKGYVYAVEKNGDDRKNIEKNIQKFQRYNIEVIPATAPDGLDELPDPDAVFIGGSAGNMGIIISYILGRIQTGGRIVINVVSLENLNSAVAAVKVAGIEPEITMVNISRSSGLLDLTRFEALNPVFIITAATRHKERNS